MVAMSSIVALLAALVALGTLAYTDVQRQERAQLQALSLRIEDAIAQSTQAVAQTLTSIALHNDDVQLFGTTGIATINRNLAQAVAGHPAVRAIQWTDHTGLVLASSHPAWVGTRLNLKRLGLLPASDHAQWGEFVDDFAWSPQPSKSSKLSAEARVLVPWVRGVKIDAERVAYLLALVDPEALLQAQQAVLGPTQTAAYLFGAHAELLASNPLARGPVAGTSFTGHAVLQQYAHQATANFVGQGIQAGTHRVSFRRLNVLIGASTEASTAASSWALQLERPTTQGWRHWLDALRAYVIGVVIAISVVLGLCMPAYRAQQHLLKARSRLRSARAEEFRDGQERIFRTDKQGNTARVSHAWRVAFGSVLAAPVGTPLVSLAHANDRAQVAALFDTHSKKKIRSAFAKMNLIEGREREFNIVVLPWKDTHGVEGFVGSAVDVTDRFETESALQRQLKLVALMLELSPLPVSSVDAQGRYAMVNQAWEEFTGLSRAQVIGHESSVFLSAEDVALHAARDAALQARGGTQRYEAKVTHKDGSRRDVIIAKVLLPVDNDAGRGWLSTMMDVSEFRRAELATLEAKEEAEEASRVKSEFTANVSHELRTPLQAILGFSELGVRRASASPSLQAMFGQIHDSGDRMLALVNNLLDLSKIESAVGPMSLIRTDLRELIPPVVRELIPLTEAKDLRIDVQLGHDNLIAKIDPDRFQQVIRNVLANAIKFSPMQGRIELWARVHNEDTIAVTVRDHGKGIPATELEAIFGAFVQSTRTKDGSGGTGLGLAICRKIIDFHGGSIRAGNNPDGGAVFTIVLPLRHFLDRDSSFNTGFGALH